MLSTCFFHGQTLADETQSIGIAMHGEVAYPPNFKHFDYVNPNAPKGGKVTLGVVGQGGGFDSFNPFILKGIAAAGGQYLYDTLTTQSLDEPFSEYPLIAEKIEVAQDNSAVTFHINAKAVFQDGKPITAKDVEFSFSILIEKGQPFYQAYYGDVEKVEVLDNLTVRFKFKNTKNRELPLILGQLPVLPRHYWKNRDFSKSSLDIPVGSGPYRIASFKAGKEVRYARLKSYWAKDLPVNRGRYNFDEIIYEYYLDTTVALEAFKSGEFDFRQENTAKIWANDYRGKQFDDGSLIKEEISHSLPSGMQGFVFNTRKLQFADAKVREALSYAFDFEWTNKQLFHGSYTRSKSYFANSELASYGLPSEAEKKLLEPLKDQVPARVFSQAYEPPKTKGDGNIRSNLRKALSLLREAGWSIKDGKLRNKIDDSPMGFEILLVSKNFERIVQPFVKNLEKLGIEAQIRLVDASQYVERVRNFDFDMIVAVIGQSNSPGNEQYSFFSSSSARQKGSRNYAGVENPAIDALIPSIVFAKNREELITATRAMDRVLLWNFYLIPQYHSKVFRVAYKRKLSHPKSAPKYGLGFDSWWIDPKK